MNCRILKFACVIAIAVFAVVLVPAQAQGPIQSVQSDQAEISFWDSVRDSTDPDELEAYLTAYPNGKFAPLAKIRLNKLNSPPSGAPASGPGADAAPVASPSTIASSGPSSVLDVIDKIKPSLVSVTASGALGALKPPSLPQSSPFTEFFDEFFKQNRNEKEPAVLRGTGLVYDESGLIVTTDELLEFAATITVSLQDGTTLDATIVGRDAATNLALLKVDSKQKLTPAIFGKSDALKLGQRIVALGLPSQLNPIATPAFVTRLRADIKAGPYDAFIQSDATFEAGMSGGAMANLAGEVVGILSPKIVNKQNLTFAVPSEQMQPVIEQIREFGEARRGWLGVKIQAVTQEIADSLKLGKPRGALVASVVADSPAAKAGLMNGDVIVIFAGKKVDVMRELPRIVAFTPPGEPVEIEVLRDAKATRLIVTLGLLEKVAVKSEPDGSASAEDSLKTADLLGLTVESAGGRLVVKDVQPNSDAVKKNIRTGEIIEEIAQEAVKTPSQALAAIRRLAEAGNKNALLMVSNQDGYKRFIALPLADSESKANATGGEPSPADSDLGEIKEDLSTFD